jgi:predicted O-methyltransferase YrrM
MGRVTEIVASSTTHLLEAMQLTRFEEYQCEFAELIGANPDLAEEDWSTEPELLEVFYCWVRCRRPHTIVEIGTYKGKAAFVLASAQARNNYGELYTIDDNSAGMLVEARRRLELLQQSNKITLLEATSHQAFSEWIRAKIDFVYLDGSHHYIDVVADFALWSRHVKAATGLIAIHDTMFRLERRFPQDYIHPQGYYDVLHVTDMEMRPSGHEWKGVGLVTAIRE